MSSTFSEMISYLKPLLSESDYNRLNHDLILRETNWKSQSDILYHRVATLEGLNLAISKELKDSKNVEAELLLSNTHLEQNVTELNSELGILRGELNHDYELKFAELKKEIQILEKQCLNWSEENRDLKEEIGKLGSREKEIEQFKVEQESYKTVLGDLILTNNNLEHKVTELNAELGILKGKLNETVKIKQAKLLSGPQADSSINVNEGQQTNAQETISCLQKASIPSPPIVELSESDEDGEIKTPKRKLSSLEASENCSKQLKGYPVNASTSVAASHIGGTRLCLINEHEDALQDDYSDQCWEYVADMLEALDKDIELCMKAVCALYQQYLNVFSRPRDVALAKFLVNGDQEGRMKRSVVELEKFDQYAFSNCRKIAFNNSTLLFRMYKSKACPLFGP